MQEARESVTVGWLNISPHERLISLRVNSTATAKEKKRSAGHWFVSAPKIEERGSVQHRFFMPKIQPSIAVIVYQLNIDAIE